jgi:hypothetical protein
LIKLDYSSAVDAREDSMPQDRYQTVKEVSDLLIFTQN